MEILLLLKWLGKLKESITSQMVEKKKLKNCDTDLFRVHDAGDLFSAKYINCWIRICEALPDIRFWFPTREHVQGLTKWLICNN